MADSLGREDMTEQTCPHCHQIIKEQDMARQKEDLDLQRLYKEFNETEQIRKLTQRVFVFFWGSIFSMFVVVGISLMGYIKDSTLAFLVVIMMIGLIVYLYRCAETKYRLFGEFKAQRQS